MLVMLGRTLMVLNMIILMLGRIPGSLWNVRGELWSWELLECAGACGMRSTNSCHRGAVAPWGSPHSSRGHSPRPTLMVPMCSLLSQMLVFLDRRF